MKLYWFTFLILIFLTLGMVSCNDIQKKESSKTPQSSQPTDSTQERANAPGTIDPSSLNTINSMDQNGKIFNYRLVPGSSKVIWSMQSSAGFKQHGVIPIKNGTFQIMDGKLFAGTFAMDMTSIEVKSLIGERKAEFEAQLKGATKEAQAPEAFNVSEYPQGIFKITNPIQKKSHSILQGKLYLNGQKETISFAVRKRVSPNQKMLKIVSPIFSIDLNRWGVSFGKKPAKNRMTDNEMMLKIQIKLSKKSNFNIIEVNSSNGVF